MADTLTATPLPALGIVKIVADFGLTWQPVNLNPYFEANVANWTGTGGTVTRSTVRAHEGTASMLLTPDGVSATAQARNTAVTVTASKVYRLSAWVWCAVARTVRLASEWLNGASVTISTTTADFLVPANTWTFIEMRATAVTGSVTAVPAVQMTGTPLAGHLLWSDEVEFSEADTDDTLPVQDDNPLHLYRVTPDGQEHEIIGSPVLLSAGQAVLYDTSAPFDVDIYYRAEIDTPDVLVDTFGRTLSQNWGTADSYTTWSAQSGGASAQLVNGAQGVHRVSARNVTYRSQANVPAMADVDAKMRYTLSASPAGDYIRTDLNFRFASSVDTYVARARTFNGGAVILSLVKVVGGVETTLASTTDPSAFTPGTAIWIEARAIGTTLQARLWKSGTAMPDWQIAASDSTHAAGDIAVATLFPNTNTSLLPYDVLYDDVLAFSPSSVSYTSNTVQLEAGRDGWVRDPQDPAKSVRLDNCAQHTFSCLDAERFVFFQGLEEEQYDSATGVFEVVDSEFPITVAQARKSAATVLRVVSTTLADIPPLKRLFSPGRDLSLSLPADYGWAIEAYGTAPFTAGNVTVGRLNQRDMRKPQRRWSIPIRVASTAETYPTGASGTNNVPVPGATYQDLADTGLTYGELAALGATYGEWSQGVIS